MTSLAVALCTYNGERYLETQLDSLARQSRQPDLLIVRDDRSDDSTMDLLRAFAATAPFECRIEQNSDRLGVIKNFESAIAACPTDLIAICDQDDVWLPTKLQALCTSLEGSPAAAGACCDLSSIAADGAALRRSVWRQVGFTEKLRTQVAIPGNVAPLLCVNRIPGASLVFRSGFRDLLLPFSSVGNYDHWIVLLLQSVSELALVDRTLQCYRIHGSNAVGLDPPRRPFSGETRALRRQARSEEVVFRAELIARLCESRYQVSHSTMEQLTGWKQHAEFRLALPGNPLRRLLRVGKPLVDGSYGQFSNGAVSAAYDVFLGG